MKKRNWLMTIAFAVLSLTIVSTMVIGTTYAKFTSTINNNGTVNAAGFLITGSTANVASNLMIAPGEHQNVQITIAYFSQVDTDITSSAVMDNSHNTGAFSPANWTEIKNFYNTNKGALKTYFGITGASEGTTNLTATNPSDLILVDQTGMLAAFEEAATGQLTVTRPNGGLRIAAMANDATSPIELEITVPVTWQTDTTGGDTFDTLLGNCIAALLNPNGNYANVTSSGEGANVVLNFGGSLNLTLALASAGTSTPSTIQVNTGFTATQHVGSAG